MLEFVLFVIGFILLVRGAEWLIDGSVTLAEKLGINKLLVGLTVVAFGTSLPELIVNLFSIDADNAELAIGNILGSNISNTFLVLGVAALIMPLTVHRLTVYREIIFNTMAAGILLLLAADTWLLDSPDFLGLDRIDGLVLLSYFIVFLYYTFGRTTFAADKPQPIFSKKINMAKEVPIIMLKILVGSLALFLGGKWIVDGAISIADTFGIADSVIGLSVVAIGTSLPELMASITAVRKKHVDIAIGNVVGSNLFNLLWVLGISSVIRPLEFTTAQLGDAFVAFLVALLLFVTVAYGRYRHQISRVEGGVFLVLYAAYLLSLTLR